MDIEIVILLCLLFFFIAVLYSLVGHGGGSGYIAVMGLIGLSSFMIKPTGLLLNMIVSSTAFYYFYKNGYFRISLLWPFLIGSIPMAYVGGSILLPEIVYKGFVGVVLLFAAARLFFVTETTEKQRKSPKLVPAIFVGMIIGLLSGLIGVGGGIFLSPLLLFLGWGRLKEVAAVSSAFVCINSIAGLIGHLQSVSNVPSAIWLFGVIVWLGGIIGSTLGSQKFSEIKIQTALSIVLLIAGVKMIVF